MPKKQFLKEKKSKHAQQGTQAPATADEYLAAGVDFEEAGEKWRGGDAAKSTRFFLRAIDTYDVALSKFPNSFDLAYNNNTAQVLTSLVEALSDSRSAGNEDNLKSLEEAIELFQRCLALQELHYTMFHVQSEAMDTQDSAHVSDADEGGVSVSDPGSQPPQDDRWATIVEPVTNDTLLDTLLVQLEALTSLCGLMNADAGKGLAWVEEYSRTLVMEKIGVYLKGTGREGEASLTKANFISALADANFRCQRINLATYERALEESFGALDISKNPEGLCNKAESMIAYNTALRLIAPADYPVSRWKALSSALESLTAASKLLGADNVAKIHLLRGDVELLRAQLGKLPLCYDVAAKNSGTLAKNAEKFYRGAKNVARISGDQKELTEALVKEALAAGLEGDLERIHEAVKLEKGVSQEVLEDAVDDGLVSIEELSTMGLYNPTVATF
ncbi:hypothetical protein B7494_g5887 [Chlorociboria aeruginascens]|nr:hypothetical protein B7494_g5887 [Chlorociboria aeruginascens]